MKKSKFLQNSKDMLSRSFNPAKCKTSLRLAGSRLKLLRNKKEVQVKQMKKEIAQLLESGQDRTARIRVEHVIREEKMMAAYDLLEIYCELLVARLPIIESQKTCPIDLKEAIASIIFASPRCGDVPELLDVRKQLTAKYGKDFTTAAIELRPQCGVGRMLVEKLSATAPDGQAKTKILSAIAEEHNVKWDPKSFEEKDPVPPSDLLGGPSTFVRSKVNDEPPLSRPEDAQSYPGNNRMQVSQLNFSQQDPRISMEAEKLASVQTSGTSKISQSEAGPPGNERAQVYQGDSNDSSLDRHGWNMEFKDATSAAQAAAESAERASMAARAAAEIASFGRITTPYSTESPKSDVSTSKDERPQTPLKSKISREQNSEGSMDRPSSGHTKLKNEQRDGIKHYSKTDNTFKEDGFGGSEEYSRIASLKSKAINDDQNVEHVVPVVDRYTQKNSSDVFRDEMSLKKQSFKHEAETSNSWTEEIEKFQEEKSGKQHSVRSSRSNSGISDDMNIFANSEALKSEHTVEDPFVHFGKGSIHGETSHEDAAAVFDKFDSDSDDHGFDMGPTYDEKEPECHFPSLGQKSPERSSMTTNSWRSRSTSITNMDSSSSLFFTRENSNPDFDENSTLKDAPELDNFVPVTFDDSEGPSSESDENMNIRQYGMEDSRNFSNPSESKQTDRSRFEDESRPSVGYPFEGKGHSAFGRTPSSLSSDDELNSKEMNWDTEKSGKFDADSSQKLSLRKPSACQPDLGYEVSHTESNDIGNVSGPENGEGLNFGKLTGGLRHKGYSGLPFLKNRSDVSSSVNKETETSPTTTIERPVVSTSLDHKKSTRKTPDLHSESDSDISVEEEPLQKSSRNKKDIYIPSDIKAVRKKSSLGAPNPIFGSDSSDLDEDPPEKPLPKKTHLPSGISRRTKTSPSYSKMHLRSEKLDSDADVNRKPTIPYISETQKKSESDRRESGHSQNYEQPVSPKVVPKPTKSNFWGPSEQHDSPKPVAVMKQESNADLSKKPSKYQSLRRNSAKLGNSEGPFSVKVASSPTNSNLEKPNSGKATSLTMQQSKISQKSSSVEEPSSPKKKSEASSSSEKPMKAETLNKTDSNKDDSVKKASHVHPKLPDYDSLVQSLRSNRS